LQGLEEDGETVPILDNAPELFFDAGVFWDAFSDLSASRQTGFSIGSIPYSEITGWLDEHDIISIEERNRYRKFIRVIDSAYVENKTPKTTSPESKRKTS